MYTNELLKILHPGFLIKTKIDGMNKWNYNIISSLYYDTLVINDIQINKDIVGVKIHIKASSPEAEYYSEASIIASQSPYLKIKLLNCQKHLNNRRYERFICNIGCNIKTSDSKIGFFSTINNLSLTGALIQTDYDISDTNHITLDIVASNDNNVLSLNGRIIRKDDLNGKIAYGVIFTNNNPKSTDKLNNLINNLQRVQEEYYDLWQKNNAVNTNETATSLKVLIVDDIKFTRSYIKNILQSHGITNIQEASNGTEAIEKVHIFNPDVITLDLSMPGMNGIETVRQLSNIFSLDRILIISAFLDDTSLGILKSLGIKHFFSKPFDQNEISEKIKNIKRR